MWAIKNLGPVTELGETWLESADELIARRSQQMLRHASVRFENGRLRRVRVGLPDSPYSLRAFYYWRGQRRYGFVYVAQGEFRFQEVIDVKTRAKNIVWHSPDAVVSRG